MGGETGSYGEYVEEIEDINYNLVGYQALYGGCTYTPRRSVRGGVDGVGYRDRPGCSAVKRTLCDRSRMDIPYSVSTVWGPLQYQVRVLHGVSPSVRIHKPTQF